MSFPCLRGSGFRGLQAARHRPSVGKALANGNRLLLDLFGSEVEAVANLDNADELLLAAAERLGTQVLDEARFVEFLANPPSIIEGTGETEGSSS